MKLFPVVIRRIAATSAGFIASVINAGVSFANRFTLLGGTVNPAVSIDATRHTHRGETQAAGIDAELLGATGTAANEVHTPAVDIDASLRDMAASSTLQNPAFAIAQKAESAWTTPTQAPAVDIDLIGATGTANEVHTPAVDIDASLRDAAAANMSQVPSFEMVRIQYDLNRRVGGNGSADVTGTWTNRANAEGIHNASDATSTGAVGAASRKLRLDYANHTDKTELTISQVNLHIYVQSAGNTGGLLGSVTMSYNIGAGEVIPSGWNARTDTFDFTTTPATIDITSAIGGDWSKLDALQTFILHTYNALSTTFTVSVDAIEVEVIASKTDTL